MGIYTKGEPEVRGCWFDRKSAINPGSSRVHVTNTFPAAWETRNAQPLDQIHGDRTCRITSPVEELNLTDKGDPTSETLLPNIPCV